MIILIDPIVIFISTFLSILALINCWGMIKYAPRSMVKASYSFTIINSLFLGQLMYRLLNKVPYQDYYVMIIFTLIGIGLWYCSSEYLKSLKS